MIGIDTATIIDLYKEEKALVTLLDTIDEPIYLNQISYMELLFGIDPENEKHSEEENYYNAIYAQFESLPLSDSSLKKAQTILWSLKKKGQIIGKMDCVIAGIYLANGVTKIITRNAKHFEHIPGLKVIPY